MNKHSDRAHWPFWVKIAIGALQRRRLFVVLSLSLFALGGYFVLASRGFNLLVGGLSLLLGVWFWLALRWVDRHGRWSE